MPPLMRFWFNLHRHNTRPLKDRQMRKLERLFFALPAKAYVRWHHLRRRLKSRRTSSEVLFYAPEEDA